MLPDCSQLLDWVRWIGQDADGSWWAYEHEPNMSDSGWYENEVGQRIKIEQSQANIDWKNSLVKINN